MTSSSRILTASAAVFSISIAINAQQPPQPMTGRAPIQLPDGPAKDAVTTTCNACHGLNMIAGSPGFTPAGWQDLIGTMIKLPDDRAAAITQYLAEHFPPKPGREIGRAHV